MEMRAPFSLVVVLCLLAAGPCALAASKSSLPAREAYPRWTVTGYGENATDAKENALAEAGRSIVAYLAKNHPALVWTPPGGYLEQRGVVRSIGSPTVEELELAGRVTVVSLRVEITPEFLADAVHMSRQQRMVERQRTLTLGLGGAVAVLIVLGGYLRLEEATRGYYTRALRLSAAGLLLLVGAGLWLLR
jgi:hypothetical protein